MREWSVLEPRGVMIALFPLIMFAPCKIQQRDQGVEMWAGASAHARERNREKKEFTIVLYGQYIIIKILC